jgi:hypothetical protein
MANILDFVYHLELLKHNVSQTERVSIIRYTGGNLPTLLDLFERTDLH